MNNVTLRSANQLSEHDFTAAQLDLIKATVAKGATNDELKLFLYRCQHMGLDPLKPGMVHFIKYGTSPGTIVIGIDGFRSKAAKTGKHVGTRRGVSHDEDGKVIGAWCEVFRSDWQHPAREEVPLSEYNTGKGNWFKMPETMIKKVAEVAALRMAFPDELGGIYSEDEMDQSEPKARIVPLTEEHEQTDEIDLALNQEVHEPGPGDYVIKAGRNKGKKLSDLSTAQLQSFIRWFKDRIAAGEKMHQTVVDYAKAAEVYLESGLSDGPDLDDLAGSETEIY